MRIAIMVEGKTEKIFLPKLREFLNPRVKQMPKLDIIPFNGRIPKGKDLKKQVQLLLGGKAPADAVIALTDVYTGSQDFTGAEDAKRKMKEWVGENNQFYPHVALHDFEAWLIPYWDIIIKQAKCKKQKPSSPPEEIDHQKPPSFHINNLYLTGKRKTRYIKVVDGKKILEKADLMIAINECPELRAFMNTLLTLCGAEEI